MTDTTDNDSVKLAVMQRDIEYLRKTHDESNTKLDALIIKIDDRYLTKDEFKPVRNIVYGLITLIVIAVIGAIVNLVVT